MKALNTINKSNIPGSIHQLRKEELELIDRIGSIKKDQALVIQLDNYSQRERIKKICQSSFPDTEFEFPTRKNPDTELYNCYVTLKQTEAKQ